MMKCIGGEGFDTYPADVQLIDIMPMILKHLAIPLNQDAQGINPLPGRGNIMQNYIMSRGGVNEYVIAESSLSKQAFKKGPCKLIAGSSSYELYNIDKDPLEQVNLAPKNPDKVYEMVRELMGILKTTRAERRNPPKITLSPQMIDELRKSGYWDKNDDE